MDKINSVLFFIAMVFFSCISVSLSYGYTNITSCGTLSSNNEYRLNGTIIHPGGNCFNIQSNVLLDCRGFNITGAGNGMFANLGIGRNNITIQNCFINNWGSWASIYGLFTGELIINNSQFVNNARGIYLDTPGYDSIQIINTTSGGLNKAIYFNHSFSNQNIDLSQYSEVHIFNVTNSNFSNYNSSNGAFMVDVSDNNNFVNINISSQYLEFNHGADNNVFQNFVFNDVEINMEGSNNTLRNGGPIDRGIQFGDNYVANLENISITSDINLNGRRGLTFRENVFLNGATLTFGGGESNITLDSNYWNITSSPGPLLLFPLTGTCNPANTSVICDYNPFFTSDLISSQVDLSSEERISLFPVSYATPLFIFMIFYFMF